MSSDGHPIFSTGGPGNTKPGRVIYRTHCERHDLEYGRELVPSTPEHESYLVGNCPKCEEEVRILEAWKQKVIQDEKEVHAEALQFCASEEGRHERVRELADALKNEDRAKRAEEFFAKEDEHFALQDANYFALADTRDLERIKDEIIERRRIAHFEERRGAEMKANDDLQKKLAEECEQRAQAALASWVTL